MLVLTLDPKRCSTPVKCPSVLVRPSELGHPRWYPSRFFGYGLGAAPQGRMQKIGSGTITVLQISSRTPTSRHAASSDHPTPRP